MTTPNSAQARRVSERRLQLTKPAESPEKHDCCLRSVLQAPPPPHHMRVSAHREHALQVGEPAGGHAAEAVPGAEHVPAPLAVARVARHAPQNEQRLDRLRPQQVVRILQ